MSYQLQRNDDVHSRSGMLTVFPAIGSGLSDSLNPGAITGLILFIVFIFCIGRNCKDVLIAGWSFIATVILVTYLSLFGVFDRIFLLLNIQFIINDTYLVLSGLFFVLGTVSLYDWCMIKKTNSPKRMIIRWPWIFSGSLTSHSANKAKEGKRRVAQLVGLGVVAGFFVSALQSVWAPHYSISAMYYDLGLPGKHIMAILGFWIYCFVFVLPMLAVLLLLAKGLTQEQTMEKLSNATSMAKIICGAMCIGLGLGLGYLFY